MLLLIDMLTDAKRILKEKRNENANEKEAIDQPVTCDCYGNDTVYRLWQPERNDRANGKRRQNFHQHVYVGQIHV